MLHVGWRLGGKKRVWDLFLSQRRPEKTHRSHSSTTFVMLHLADCMMARWNIRAAAVLPFHPRPPSRTEGITLGASEKNKAIHCYFIPGSAKPQPNHSWLLTLSCLTGLRHTPLCQCLVQKCGEWKNGEVCAAKDLSCFVPKVATKQRLKMQPSTSKLYFWLKKEKKKAITKLFQSFWLSSLFFLFYFPLRKKKGWGTRAPLSNSGGQNPNQIQ